MGSDKKFYQSLDEISYETIKNTTLQEYFEIKNNNKDSIVLFQIGGFFEAFFEDARLLSKIAAIETGSRLFENVGRVIQTGFPKKSLNTYVKKMLDAGQKICVCEQSKDEDGEAYRTFVRKYTRGTVFEDEFLDSYDNNYILVLLGYKDKFYLSYADVSTGQLYKTFGTKAQIINEINKISPSEIIIPISQKEDLSDFLGEYYVNLFEDEFFSHLNLENTIIEYCLQTQKAFAPKLNKTIDYDIDKYLVMDQTTRTNLELTRTKMNFKKKGSAFWFLNDTKTPMGSRLLKKYISEPLLNISHILERQNAIQELIDNPEKLNKASDIMSNFSDISRMCAKISNSTIAPKDLFLFFESLSFFFELQELCLDFKSSLLKINNKKNEKILDIIEEIKSALSENSSNELKSGNIINDGYYGNLDYIRMQIADELKNIETYIKKEKKRLNLKTFEFKYSRIVGYYIETDVDNLALLPSDYKRVQVLSKCARIVNDKIKTTEAIIDNLIFKRNELEYELFCNIRKKVSVFVDLIREIASDIARIDVLITFAKCAIDNKFSKPNFNSEGFYIKDGYHPSLIKLRNEIIKNDTILENNKGIILTGANMSGKSTFLKYNAIISIFSQMGAFVPARSADVCIIDKIFLRQGAVDDIVNNNSSFMVEMNDLKTILDNSTKNSLILLDEPAKSTSEAEGGAIARAFLKYLMENKSPKTIVVTHNIGITKATEDVPECLENYTMGDDSGLNSNEINRRKIKKGVFKSSCAIDAALLAGLPDEIIENAKENLKIIG